jgi:hypothetical protein
MAERNELDAEQILDALSALRDQASEALQAAAERLQLERRLRENPMGTLAVAAGAGFVLGGGLWPAVRPFARAAVRTLLSPQNLVALAAAAGALKAATASQEESTSAAPTDPTPTEH